MPEFLELMKAMQTLQETFPDVRWSVTSNGVLKIEAYAGIENYDLYRSARDMFATED